MATLALKLLLIALFSSAKTEINGQIITDSVELHTTVYLPCSMCPISRASTNGVQWYRSSNRDVFIKDGEALAWWSLRRNGSSQGYGIKDDLSMIIHNITAQHDQELYRCIVFPVGGAAEFIHDVKLDIYANPDSSPVIEYIREANGFNVTCSINNVFPMTFPILKTKDGKRAVYNNSDETYNTTMTHWFPANEKDTTIECLYSNLNFKFMSSLRIVDNYINDHTKEGDRMQNNMTDMNCRYTPSGLWMIWMTLIIQVLFVIVIVCAIKCGRVRLSPALRIVVQNSIDIGQDGGNSKEKEPGKTTRNMLCGKLSYVVITFQIAVLIMLVAYLATASLN